MTEHSESHQPDQNESLVSNSETFAKFKAVIDRLLPGLSFTPSEELNDAAVALLDGIKYPEESDPTLIRAGWVEYARITEAEVEASAEYAHAQIAVIIHKAAIFHGGGNDDRYIGELDLADTYAGNVGLETLSEALRVEIETTAQTLRPSPELLIVGLKDALEESDREYLRELLDSGTDFEDLIGAAYGMILEQGGDPEETLGAIGIIE